MLEDQKENLVVVHSFPTNSALLGGFYDYLGSFFNVYPVDLPGFTRNTQPLEAPSLANYGQFVQDKVKDMSFDQFLLGGVSFGFAVVNSAVPDERCKGILAIEPYLNADSLQLSAVRRSAYLNLLNLATLNGLGERFWTSPLFHAVLGKVISYPPDRIAAMTDDISGKAFFETAKVILKNQDAPVFHDLPYALIVNPSDSTVNYDHLLQTFQKGVRDLHVVHTRVDHYPDDMTSDYFENRVNAADIRKMRKWFAEKAQ